MRKKFFSDSEIQKINAAITDAEKNTIGEILPVIVPESSSYAWLHFVAALVGMVAISLVLILSGKSDWGYSVEKILLIQLCGALLAAAFTFFPPLRRAFLPKHILAAKVHEAALANFLATNIIETEARTGVMIYISFFERRVEILADKGIHSKVPANYWETEVKRLVEGLQQGKSADALVQVIKNIGSKLTEHFPGRLGNRNEIADEIRGKSY